MKRSYAKLHIAIKYLRNDVITASSPTDPFSIDIFGDEDFVTGGEK